MKVLVLGGDGFIGSHLTEKAVDMGHDVTVFDRFDSNTPGNLKHMIGKVRFLSGDINDCGDVENVFNGQDIVYHFISETNPASSWFDPLVEVDRNIKSSLKIFKSAVQAGVKKIVFSSSGGTVYGVSDGPIDENTPPNPSSPYGIAKLASEHFLTHFQKKTGISADIYRTGNVYGPRQPMSGPQGVIALWMGKILGGERIEVYGGADTKRDYVYVEDAAFLMTHSLRFPESSGLYNIGTGKGTSVVELLEIFKKVIKESFIFSVHSRRAFDNASIVLNSSRLLSYFPGFKFQELEDKIAEMWTSAVKSKHESLNHARKNF